jgi:hypothetical protein
MSSLTIIPISVTTTTRGPNEVYVFGRLLPKPRNVAAVIYALLLGRHDAPGVASWPLFVSRSGGLRRVLAVTAVATWGRLSGLSTIAFQRPPRR